MHRNQIIVLLLVAFAVGVFAAPHILPPKYSIKIVYGDDAELETLGADGYHVVGAGDRGIVVVQKRVH